MVINFRQSVIDWGNTLTIIAIHYGRNYNGTYDKTQSLTANKTHAYSVRGRHPG